MLGAIGPVLGIICCAILFDKIGGYTSELAVPVCGIFGLCGMVFGLASVMVRESAVTAAILIMLELFCGAFVMPACTGIMLNQVPPKLRTMANSVANFSYNLFGYLPAPIMYGFFYELGDAEHNHYGLLAIQIFTVFALCGFTYSYYRSRLLHKKYASVEDFRLIGLDGEVNSREAFIYWSPTTEKNFE